MSATATPNVVRDLLRPGDTVLVGQAAAEPATLVAQLLEAAADVDDITAMCGYTLSQVWSRATPGHPHLRSYSAQGPLRRLADGGLVDIVPMHYSQIEHEVRGGRLAADVVLLQVGPLGDDGYYPLGATVDYVALAAETARAVLVEINTAMPRTHATRALHRSRVTAEITSTTPLPDSPSRSAKSTELDVAARVVSLIDDGTTVQLGITALAEAIAARLAHHQNLRIRSGLVSDWLVDLYEVGAMAPGPATCVTGMVLGTERLYRFVDRNDQILLAPLSRQIDADELSTNAPMVSVNSAIEVDRYGQVNAEVGAGRYVGAVGGQVDFFRAARSTPGGLAVVALEAGSGSASRIVRELSGPVTTSKSDVDIVVTEWGVADLRGADFRERVDRLAGVAAPEVRADLVSELPSWALGGPDH